jgi:hypothetical protein
MEFALCRRSGEAYAVIAADEALASVTAMALSDTAAELSAILHPAYGIGFARKRQLGPTFYAIGVSQGLASSGPEYEEALQISRWSNIGRARRVYQRGLLRDVYPHSWLNLSQRSSSVCGVSLETWIESDPLRGKLQPEKDGLRRWDVEPPHLPEIRNALWQAGVIFDWRMHGNYSGDL